MRGRRALEFLLFLSVALPAPGAAQESTFGRQVARFSENGGFFDSDNLVSNETSYLHVLGAFEAYGIRGGAYIGVGPEQNFSYIARARPEIAFLIDIRRDNMLLHLLFKAMFEASRNRMEFLSLLYGRPAPTDLPAWNELPLVDLLTRIDRTSWDSIGHARTHEALMAKVSGYGVPLTPEDRTTLRRFHDEFAVSGLDIRFTSRGRPIRFTYPTARDLYSQTDLEGNQASYLSTEDGWRVVRDLSRRDRMIPVVGDLAGPTAVKEIGRYLTETGRKVSVLYVSNVEMYLYRYGTFGKFVDNVRALPAGPNSVILRSYFGRGMGIHPQAEPGHLSVQIMQTVPNFLNLMNTQPDAQYWTVVTTDLIELKAAARP
jgi:hypothetical protein